MVSRSKSRTSTNTTQIDRRIGVTDQGVVLVAEGEGSAITLTDQGAIGAAGQLVSETVTGAFDFAQRNTESAIGLAQEAAKASEERQFERIAQVAGIVAVVAFGAQALSNG